MPVAPSFAKWFHVLLVVTLFGLAFVVAAFLSALGSVQLGNWRALLHVGVLFGVLGSIYGCAAALDSRSEFSVGDHPYVRTVLSALLGASAVFVVWSWFPENFNLLWSCVGGAVGAVLGWFGWRWAQHVDF